MNAYSEMKHRHQLEINAFPMFLAFNNEQFDRGMRKFGLDPADTNKIYRFKNISGYYLRENADKLWDMLKRHEQELTSAIENDATGDGFIFEMFDYELANHEFIVSGDVSDTFDVLGLTLDEIKSDGKLLHGLKKAIIAQREGD